MGLAMVTYTILNIYLYQQDQEEQGIEMLHELQVKDAYETEVMLENTMKNDMSPGQRALIYNRSKSLDLGGSGAGGLKRKRPTRKPAAVRNSEITASQLNASQHSIIHQ